MNSLATWIIAGVLISAAGEAGDAIKKDKASLQGTWKVVESISKGEKVPADDLKELYLIFRDDAILIREGGKTAENFSFRLDPTKKIKEIDVTLKVGPQKNRIDRGIYEIDGDKLRICIQANKDAARPNEFLSRPNSELWLVVLQRSKE
ncbi:MAG: TIGR03067 domain-containing protein [Planctomycetes bacterium]|nr:TIGR03067 domain-containing protein [Planctomycetota bacterium]